MRTTTVYVDGFNFYYGSVKGTPYRWLDFHAFAATLLPKHSIEHVKYFTARVDDRPEDLGQSQRQDIYLQALATIPTVEIHLGKFRTRKQAVPLAKRNPDGTRDTVMALVTEEKETDVNMGAHLVWDACHRAMETALVVSNDSDLQTPITMAMALGVEVIVVNPHRHKQQRIHLSGSDRRNIRRSHLVAAQLPEIVQARDGLVRRPAEWA